MELIELTPQTDEKRETFFKLVFGQAKGIMCLAFITAGGKKFTEEFYRYPDELPIVTKRINEEIRGNNIYFCSQLLRERKRVKENVERTPNVWADLDSCEPELMLVPPSCVLETSPASYQAFWVLDNSSYDPDEVEEICRRIAYKHKNQGADNGWALSKLLRVPYTYNYKYTEPQVVKVIGVNRNQYRPSDFHDYPELNDYIKVDDPPPNTENLKRAEDILQESRATLNPIVWALFSEEPLTDWSRALWKLLLALHESGFTSEEVYVIATEAACNKYARDGRPATQLWKDVVRAKARVELSNNLLRIPDANKVTILLTNEERDKVDSAPPTFIERYIKWASSLGDAAPQYHQAGAIVALSSILAGSVRLPTSYGIMNPNLWFMILADTTLTRKTTAMDIAMDLVSDVDDDAVMATDGSIEGLLTSLSTRPNRPSIFLRDEFSGLLEQMTKKDYMAGMAELLTKLYDCKMQKRVLRNNTVEVRDPRLIIFAGGILDNVTGLLTTAHVSSGFLPRFIFITAESDISKFKPIGPPTVQSLAERTKILAELQLIHDHYDRTQVIQIVSHGTTATQKVIVDATMTTDAWVRYNKLESVMLTEAMDSDSREIMMPINDRLSKSILKVALLIAASRQFDEELVIEEIDILRAAKYGEEWAKHSKLIVSNIGKGANERLLDKIMIKANKTPEGVKRGVLMQNLHLSGREMTFFLETLEQRGLITRVKAGKGETIHSTNVGKLSK